MRIYLDINANCGDEKCGNCDRVIPSDEGDICELFNRLLDNKKRLKICKEQDGECWECSTCTTPCTVIVKENDGCPPKCIYGFDYIMKWAKI